MAVINNATLRKFSLPGLEHQTLAARGMGVNVMEVWMQTIAPGAATPVHRHACEGVIVILRGSGLVTIEGKETNSMRTRRSSFLRLACAWNCW